MLFFVFFCGSASCQLIDALDESKFMLMDVVQMGAGTIKTSWTLFWSDLLIASKENKEGERIVSTTKWSFKESLKASWRSGTVTVTCHGLVCFGVVAHVMPASAVWLSCTCNKLKRKWREIFFFQIDFSECKSPTHRATGGNSVGSSQDGSS